MIYLLMVGHECAFKGAKDEVLRVYEELKHNFSHISINGIVVPTDFTKISLWEYGDYVRSQMWFNESL